MYQCDSKASRVAEIKFKYEGNVSKDRFENRQWMMHFVFDTALPGVLDYSRFETKVISWIQETVKDPTMSTYQLSR